MADDNAKGEPYKVDIQAILNEKGFDRPQKDITNENIELKSQIFLLQDKINNMREMIEMYTIRTDDITSDQAGKLKQLKKIDELVVEVQVEKDNKKDMKEKIVELQQRYTDKKAETKQILAQTKEQIAKSQDELREQYNERKRQIAYFEHFMSVDRIDIQIEIENLKDLIAVEKEMKEHSILQLDKEKNERMEKMRKEMLLEVKQVKTDMLNFTEDKLQGTTRLTIKQNKQLTSELEFQSKQTENLIYQNGTMTAEIKALQKDLKLHQEVEKELAKRSHFCHKVIEKYQEQLKNAKEALEQARSGTNEKDQEEAEAQREQDTQELASFLEKRTSEIDVKLRAAQSDLESLKEEHALMIAKVAKERRKFQNCALLLSEYLDAVLQNAGADVIAEDQDIHLDVEKLKTYEKFVDVPAKDQVGLLLVLLKQLQPFLNASVMDTQQPEQPTEVDTSLVQPQVQTSGYFSVPKRQGGGILKRNVQAASALNNYASQGEILRQRSPGAWHNNHNDSHLSQPSLIKQQGFSRNAKGIGAQTQMKPQINNYHSTQNKTVSTKAGSMSRPSANILPQIAANSASRQDFLRNASRALNSQSALSLQRGTIMESAGESQTDSKYPYATLAVKRKLHRLQHLQQISANGGVNPNDTFKNSFGKIFHKNGGDQHQVESMVAGEADQTPMSWNIRQMQNSQAGKSISVLDKLKQL